MAAIMNPDGTVEVPVTAAGPGLFGDGQVTLRPGDHGYEAAAAAAIPADQHPLLRPRDLARAAELESLFAAWEHRASA
jgi:hypothetical protein